MIDRKARDAMVEAIRSYMDQKIASFKFDETLCQIAGTSKDESVQMLPRAVWGLYSDIEDHKITVSKSQWDYLNRLLLLLSSDIDFEIEWTRAGRRWSSYKTLCALCLAGFGLVGLWAGMGKLLVVYWIVSGFVVLALFRILLQNDERAFAPKRPIFPFPSVGALFSVRRQVPEFARERYTKSMSRKAAKHSFLNKIMWILWSPVWVAMAPLGLLLLALPIRQWEMRLKMPADGV